MNYETVTLTRTGSDEVVEKVRDYSERRGFQFRPIPEEQNAYHILNKKPESSAILSSVELLVGISQLPERLRLKMLVEEKDGGVEVKLGYEVIMRQFEIVNNRPSKRDEVRGAILLDGFLEYFKTLERNL